MSGAGTGGGSGSATGGTGTNPPAGGTTSTGTAGTAPGTAGTTSAGAAGTTSTGGMTGTAGAPTGGCPAPPAAGTITDLKIDDLEDGDNALLKIGGRSGYWYTYLDALGSTITPPPGKTTPLKPDSTDCHGASTKCIVITGTTIVDPGMKYPYAGVGFDFSNAMQSCIYNATAYTGIKFWARGNVPVTIKLNTVATTVIAEGGTCVGAMCNGGYSPTGADVPLTTTWTEITLPFATAMGPTWGVPGPPDKSKLLGLQVQVPPGQPFTVALDDLTFY